ncbi:unnamed protein product [Cylindrotheca closterium]|uniref:Uncharacterized protein n=1 Tax=Cylindrotheca closterium TaxID=2856 RepID=A0AAD2CCN4_9STRA|nr:unnamed protein product [Cylindrotheca closterium]
MLQQRLATARKVLALLTCLSYLLICADALLLPRFSSVIDRNEFLSIVIVSTGQLIPSSWFVEKQLQHDDSSSVIIPLRFLPVGGSWAIKILVANNDERDDKYYAVVDTGSPFLTVPSSLASVTERTTYPMTKEQYGQDISEMDWKKIPYVTILTNSSVIDTENLVVGMEETQQPNQEAGSAFAGLVNIDDNRPTFLEQLTRERISAFTISFARNYLQLSQRSLIDKRNPAAFPLVDLRPYGPDLYHYAVDSPRLVGARYRIDRMRVLRLINGGASQQARQQRCCPRRNFSLYSIPESTTFGIDKFGSILGVFILSTSMVSGRTKPSTYCCIGLYILDPVREFDCGHGISDSKDHSSSTRCFNR